ncbi:hypothetical protein [Aquamicrobium soli]|uniref:Sulfotransferase family protein n=1 Tax=Aquamicrobium soli TaxID=1811518 RepID=A0ABV7KAP4_9HYPH
MKVFKLYGLFRSGTNLLKLLIEQNMEATCRVNIGGHKHLYTPINFGNDGYEPPSEDILVCVKDPYANMHSLFKYAHTVDFQHFQCDSNWDAFLRSRFVVSLNTQPKVPGFLFRTPVDYWNSHYFHMLSLPEARTMIIRYEDVLSNPGEVLQRIASRFPAANLTNEAIKLPWRRLRRMGEDLGHRPLTYRPFNMSWYSERRYMQEFSDDNLAAMREALDADVVKRLSYSIV